MKILIAIIVLIAALLSGCACTKTPGDIQYVNVLVPVKCQPTLQITLISDYPTSKIMLEMTLFEKTQLVLAELFLVEGQNKELKAALGECTK